MLDAARDKAGRTGLDDVLEFRCGDMSATGLPSASFDAVVCVFGLVLVPDMTALAARAVAPGQPGGRLVVTTWGPRLWAPMTDVWKSGSGRRATRPRAALRPLGAGHRHDDRGRPWPPLGSPRRPDLGHARVRPLAAAHAARLVVDGRGHRAALDGRPADRGAGDRAYARRPSSTRTASGSTGSPATCCTPATKPLG